MQTNHKFSPEQLIHFICGRCRKPWTVSTEEDVTTRAWTCPTCTYNAELEPMPPMDEKCNGNVRIVPDEITLKAMDRLKSENILKDAQRDLLMLRKLDSRERSRQFWRRIFCRGKND